MEYCEFMYFLSTIQPTSGPAMLCKRHLSLHEHLSMGIVSKYGVSVPRGEMAITPEQAKDVADRFGMRLHKISFIFPVWYPQTFYICILILFTLVS